MALEGLHHVTAITGDAKRNVDWYTRVLGLRLVKKTVNFDSPDVYHLYYGDDLGTPGSILTFFEFPGATPGRAGGGMVHRIVWRVGSAAALDFWHERLNAEGAAPIREDEALRFADAEGLAHELVIDDAPDSPLIAHAAGIDPEHAIAGFAGVRAYADDPGGSTAMLEALGFSGGVVAGEQRRATYGYDAPPTTERGVQSAGTVHHVAWSAADDAELSRLREVVLAAGGRPTEIIDRQYFHSVYFREPSGVLFELATRDIGFTVDEPADTLGQALKLPPQYERFRTRLERSLTPL